jgi:hypothetical protein
MSFENTHISSPCYHPNVGMTIKPPPPLPLHLVVTAVIVAVPAAALVEVE